MGHAQTTATWERPLDKRELALTAACACSSIRHQRPQIRPRRIHGQVRNLEGEKGREEAFLRGGFASGVRLPGGNARLVVLKEEMWR